jgi:predicted helicase
MNPLITRYYQEIDDLYRFGGDKKETALRGAFQDLLKGYLSPKGLKLVPEISLKTPKGKTVTPDGTIKDSLRLDWGYWEAKDEFDDLDLEIAKKVDRGYPTSNTLFEDTQTAVLYQGGAEVRRVRIEDADALDSLLDSFVGYQRPEVRSFREAIESFRADLPEVLEKLRSTIAEQEKTNAKFQSARDAFLDTCQKSINPDLGPDDVREMIIQHILTEDIFRSIFDETQFHDENNIARELGAIVDTFFQGDIRRAVARATQHYYDVIKAQAAQIADHHEKQRFLKVIYETFYKAYNPKKADRLGIVYTPQEIVRFMIESTDALLHRHFGTSLGARNVEIMDPATGTGTFICDLIDYLPTAQLEHKYRHELHANEVDILPYYIANLNIEYTYRQRMKQYVEFPNLVFVDTLDNLGFGFQGKALTMDFGLGLENQRRIQQQNARKISVIIGNPPYNANQQNENDNNKNREYPGIDRRIKDTYIKASTAQKTKLYDMYARFFRWASDRLSENGVIAFISNNSFVNARTFDGFRKCISEEFHTAYIIDLGGNIRELSGKDGIFLNEKNTIFGVAAAVGIAITFLVKKESANKEPCRIKYIHPCDIRATRDEKLEFLAANKIEDIAFTPITPDKNHYWINLADTDWDTLMPVADKATKLSKRKEDEQAIFKLFSLGVVTARDEWVYDFDEANLEKKVKFLIKKYNEDVDQFYGKIEDADIKDNVDYSIKWTRAVKNDLSKGKKYKFNKKLSIRSLYRPFVSGWLYFSASLNEMQYQLPKLFGDTNKVISISGSSTSKPFQCLSTDAVFSYDELEKTQCLPLYRYEKDGTRVDNITDWALAQFRAHYSTPPTLGGVGEAERSEAATGEVSPPLVRGVAPKARGRSTPPAAPSSATSPKVGEVPAEITKEAIFHYVYAVLHHPAYRQKYELNLKREFPRVPLYPDFWQWAAWGEQLMALHIGYEAVAPFGLKRVDTPDVPPGKAKLKAEKDVGRIILDDHTALTGVPAEAWLYKLGNRSALEWVLDQYKEKTPKDPTIRERFNTYRFADYKEHVIDLLQRVTTVSVETQRIIAQMPS